MSSSPLESGFNMRDWPVKTGHSETIVRCHPDEWWAFRPCGRDVAELFNSTGWAFPVQVDYFRVTDSGALSVLTENK